MALAEALLAARFGREVVDHRTYVIVGDGCLMEGISHEAISLAGHLRLNKLIVLFDDNRISIDGPTDLSVSDDQRKRFEASGWNTWAVDGQDPDAVASAITAAHGSEKPAMIACRTVIGFGAPTLAGTAKTHGSPLGETEIKGARDKLGWPHAPFVVPEEVLSAWRGAGAKGGASRDAWTRRLDGLAPDRKKEFRRLVADELPDGWQKAIAEVKKQAAAERPKVATRQSSQTVLDGLTAAIPELIGGSADLTGSNNTKAAGMKAITAGDFSGRYLYYGVREHGMAAAMNGLALHGGVIPYGGTFLVFTDYCRPAIRLSALMGQRVIYVMTHDSIGLGEDGPTHQPVEHLASLRAISNLLVMRPCDTVETAECWAIAVEARQPSILALTRQAVPTLRTNHIEDNLCAKGGYVLAEAEGRRQVTVIATGSEVCLAMDARAKLQADGIGAAVVSLPCWELFDAQPNAYREEVLGKGAVRVAIEAASAFGWDRYVGGDGAVIGMPGFGASAPAPDLYKHFAITADAVVAAAKARL
jgi:transketolase